MSLVDLMYVHSRIRSISINLVYYCLLTVLISSYVLPNFCYQRSMTNKLWMPKYYCNFNVRHYEMWNMLFKLKEINTCIYHYLKTHYTVVIILQCIFTWVAFDSIQQSNQVQSIPRRTHVPPLTDASVNAHTVRWSTDGGLSYIMVDTYLLNTIIQSY